MRHVLLAVLLLALGGCSLREANADLAQQCQSAKDIMATGLPVDEFKPDPAPPLPTDVLDPRGKQAGEEIEVAAVADADPQVLKDQLTKAVTARGWDTAGNTVDGPDGSFVTTYRGPDVQGNVTLLPCVDDQLVLFTQQGK